MNAKEKTFALRTARSAVELWARERKRLRPANVLRSFYDERGCFVTLTEEGELRGCIGYPEPVKPLIDAIIDSARNACRDPRFPPLDPSELGKIRIEVSILTKPKPIKPADVKVGRDGLIIRQGFRSGLLLPQVAVEYGWTKDEFLQHTCIKAGLTPGAWKEEGTELLAFQAEVFGEK
jgi:AmmeMemoRadiSam system protein A